MPQKKTVWVDNEGNSHDTELDAILAEIKYAYYADFGARDYNEPALVAAFDLISAHPVAVRGYIDQIIAATGAFVPLRARKGKG